jgi:outer membrane lipoprotein SlyB
MISMVGRWFLALFAPLALTATLSACNGQGVQPGVVQTSAAESFRGETGRVVSIREVAVRGSQQGVSDGTLVGGGVGAAGGAIAGAAIGGNAGSAILGGVLGAVGGAIAGTAIDRSAPRQGIEVTVQKDDGTTVVIAQRDDGDVQMGDRVNIVYDRNGVARVVRDTGRRRDY